MEKAYDGKALVELLKDKGLDVAEDAAKVIVDVLFNWIQMSALASSNKVDDIIAGLLPAIKPYILEQVDKIDGEVG